MWEFIDKTFVLTIDSSTEAQTIISKHLKEIGLPFEMVIFPSFNKNKSNECKDEQMDIWKIMKHETTDEVSESILNNHLSLMQRALYENYKNVLILEDDAIFQKPDPHKLKRISVWLSKNYYDAFYFGYCNWFKPISFLRGRDVVRLVSPLCTHAIMYSRMGLQKVIGYYQNNKINNIHIDKLLTIIPDFEKFGIFPMINFQNKDPGLYKRGLRELKLPNISFTQTSRTMEYISVIIPFLIIIIFMILLIKLYSWILQK